MSTPKRFFVDRINYPGETEIYIEGDEFTHAKTVLRVEEGAEIVLLDNTEKQYSAIVAKIEKRRLLAHITGVTVSDKQPKTPIFLLCGALKGDKTELVVQKACELGVSKIGVFDSEYCSAYFNENKVERLCKVAREAAKQCLRSSAPEIEYFNDFKSAVLSAEGYKHKFFACEFLGESEGDISSVNGSVAIMVGSEGGFTEGEFALAKENGFLGISLGKRILRAETACIAVCALAAYALGELK